MALLLRPTTPPRLRLLSRLSYQDSADRRCRRRRRGSPRLLERLLTRLSQSRHLYLLNMWRRGGPVPLSHRGAKLRVHRGKHWRVLSPSKWHCSTPWGSFARTRKVAAFKARAANKKRKKVSKGAQIAGEMRILQYRAIQLGHKRRTSTKLSAALESQLRSVGP